MNLRPRLALTVLALGVPLIGGVFWARARLERRTMIEGLTRLTVSRMENGGRTECERRPETWPLRPESGRDGARPHLARGMPRGEAARNERERRGGGPPAIRGGVPVDLFAYRIDLTSANPDAPPMPEVLAKSIRAGEGTAATGHPSDEGGLLLAVRMSWHDEPGSPCAVILARQRKGDTPSLAHEFLGGAIAVSVLMLIAMLAAAGPLVERVRRLTHEVHRAAEDHYANPIVVDGKDEVTELADAFNTAGTELRAHTEALEHRQESLRNFVEGTTHDVMLPLTVLQGHLAHLRGRVDSDCADALADALEEAHYMASLVRNLSTAAKLEAADERVRRDPVDLTALVERVVARHEPIAREKDVTLEPVVPGEPLVISGDGTLLEQAVSNLAHNAVRYVDRGGRVLIVLSDQGGRFSIRVIDDGPGIPDNQLEHLTERRWRADAARTRHPDGSGLGLAIAREVALRHGLELRLRASESLGGLEAGLEGPLSRV